MGVTMAGLKKMKGKYYIRVRKRTGNDNYQTEILIPTKTHIKSEAISRRIAVEKYEKDIKCGDIKEFQFKELFGWLNKKGTTKLVTLNLTDAIADYLVYRQTMVRNSTANRDRIALNQLADFIGNKPVNKLTYKDIEGANGLIEYQRRNGYADSGINISLRHIKTFFKWMHDKEKMISEPIKFNMINEGEKLYYYFNESELNAIHNYDGIEDMFKRFFYFYEQTGVRAMEPFVGELMGDWLIVDSSKSKGKNVRDIHLTEELKTILQEMQSFRNTYIDMGSKRPNEGAYERISKMLQKAVRELNFKGKELTIKSFRHTYGIRRVTITGDIFQVAREMGHKNVTTTQHYLRFPEQRRLDDFPSLAKHIENKGKSMNRVVNFRVVNQSQQALS